MARVATSYTSCMSTSRVRLLPSGTGNMALKPPFSSLYYCSEVPGSEASSPVPWPLIVPPPPRSSPPVGIEGWHNRGRSALLGQRVTPLSWEMLKPGNAHTWRRPYLATPIPGDAHIWRRPFLAKPKAVNTLTFLFGAPWCPTVCLTLVNAPGQYTSPPSLELITVFSEKTKASPYRLRGILMT